MSRINVVGIDPGPMPGIVSLQFVHRRLEHVDVIQCNYELAPGILSQLLLALNAHDFVSFVQVEQFVIGRRSARSSTPEAGQQTRDLVGALQQVCCETNALVGLQNASCVKTWATDLRLQKADLWRATAGMRHARDAARHALFCASAEAGLPDPLSKEWRSA